MSLDLPRPRVAKANVNAVDVVWMRAIGAAITRAIELAGWSHKEAAAKVGVDPAELTRWKDGERRPQFDRLFRVEDLRQPLVTTLAALADGEVVTEIRFRRRRTA
jgi:transcriptional regulator with XRE-family HTH domain